MLLKNVASAFCLFCLLTLLAGCKPEQEQIDGYTMGTYYTVKYLIPSSKANVVGIRNEIDIILIRINNQMSIYDPDSEITLFNESRTVNEPFPVSKETVSVIKEALRISGLTDHALDITAAPLVNLWGFSPETRAEVKPPPLQELKQRLSWTGPDKLKIEGDALIKTVPQLSLDLSAIAKGYAVDVIAEYLDSIGIHDYLVDIGGEVRANGKNQQGKPWRVAIEKPLAGLEPKVQRVIELSDMAAATSGDYRDYFDDKGGHYSHTIDPKTGYPIQNGVALITVIAPSCMTADGFSTGLGVLGADRAIDIANRLDLAIFMIVKTDEGFQERYSEPFEKYLTVTD